MSKFSKGIKKVAKGHLDAITLGQYDKATGKPQSAADMGGDKEAQFAQMIKEIQSAAPEDQARIMKEVEEQKRLGTENAAGYSSKRAQMLDKLSGVLADQQNRQLMQNIPGLAEQANLSGIFRSTGLGNSIADRAKTLAADTSSELAKYGIQNQEADLADIQGVNNNYLEGRYSGLSRALSLEDMARQGVIAKTTGQILQPAPVKTPSGKGSGALQGGLSGAATGATVGGPMGAVVGGTIGAVGGGKLGSK